MQTLAGLEAELEAVEAKLARHYQECERASGRTTNPAGDIGGIRSRSQKRKNQIFDRTIRLAHEGVALERKKQLLERQIAYIKAAPKREARDLLVLAWWDSLKIGDTFQPGNTPLTIIRKNALSVTVQGGERYGIGEVTMLRRARIEELRAIQAGDAKKTATHADVWAAYKQAEERGADGLGLCFLAYTEGLGLPGGDYAQASPEQRATLVEWLDAWQPEQVSG